MIDWNIQQFEKFTRIWNWFWKCSKLWPLRCLYVYNYATDKIYARSVMFVMSNIWPHDAIKSSHRYKSVCLSIGYLAWVLYVYEVMGQTCFTNRSIKQWLHSLSRYPLKPQLPIYFVRNTHSYTNISHFLQ